MLYQRDSGLRGDSYIQGGVELCGARVKTGGTTTIVPVLSPPLTWLADWHHFSCVEPSLTQPNLNLHCPGKHHLLHPSDSLRPCLIQLTYHLRLFQWLSFTGSLHATADLKVP